MKSIIKKTVLAAGTLALLAPTMALAQTTAAPVVQIGQGLAAIGAGLAVLGGGIVEIWHLGVSAVLTAVLLFVGLVMFNRAEKTFMDTV